MASKSIKRLSTRNKFSLTFYGVVDNDGTTKLIPFLSSSAIYHRKFLILRQKRFQMQLISLSYYQYFLDLDRYLKFLQRFPLLSEFIIIYIRNTKFFQENFHSVDIFERWNNALICLVLWTSFQNIISDFEVLTSIIQKWRKITGLLISKYRHIKLTC